MLGVLAKERDVARRLFQRVLDKRPREPDPAIITGDGPHRGHIGNAGIRRLAEADFLQDLIDRLIDGLYRGVIKRTVLPAGKTGADRTQFLGQRGGADRSARSAAT